jgi:hypothetical protein
MKCDHADTDCENEAILQNITSILMRFFFFIPNIFIEKKTHYIQKVPAVLLYHSGCVRAASDGENTDDRPLYHTQYEEDCRAAV